MHGNSLAVAENPLEHIENRTFDEIAVGDSATLERTLTEQDIKLFAVMSGDINPAHVDPDYALSSRFREVIGHGMWSGALISTVLGTAFPGPGTIYLGQNLRFRRPVKVGDTITIKVTAKEKDDKGRVMLDTDCVNQDGEIVVSGTAEVTNGDQVILLSENQSTYIPLGQVHRLANPGKVPLEIIEVQSGSYLGEDDIVRFDDHYGRG